MTKKSANEVMPVRSRTRMSAAFLDSAARTATSQVGVAAWMSMLLRLSYYNEGYALAVGPGDIGVRGRVWTNQRCAGSGARQGGSREVTRPGGSRGGAAGAIGEGRRGPGRCPGRGHSAANLVRPGFDGGANRRDDGRRQPPLRPAPESAGRSQTAGGGGRGGAVFVGRVSGGVGRGAQGGGPGGRSSQPGARTDRDGQGGRGAGHQVGRR